MKNYIKKIGFKVIPYLHDYYCYCIADLWPMSYWKYIWKRWFSLKPYWPVEPGCIVLDWDKIYVGKNSNVGRPGNYINGGGGIYIGNYVRITTNVGIISRNHDLYDHKTSHPAPIIIHDYCWIAMGAKILAGVEIGPRTIVASNAVVTKSFPKGNCVLAGVPAKVIKELDPEKVVHYKLKEETYGYLNEKQFYNYKKKYLKKCPFFDQDGKVSIEDHF